MAKVFLLTGLSGAGKTTLAEAVYKRIKTSINCVILDGDAIRKGVNSDLGFSAADRRENIRRCGEIAKLLTSYGITVILAIIAPYEYLRNSLKSILGEDTLRIIHVSCPVDVCINRDPKKNYEKALAGDLKNYTGIGDKYEEPSSPDLIIRTDENDINKCRDALHDFIARELGLNHTNPGSLPAK